MVNKEVSQQFFCGEVFRLLAKELWRRYYLKGSFGVSIGLGIFETVDSDPLRKLLGLTPLVWSKKKRIAVLDVEAALENSVVTWDLTDFVTIVLKKELVLKTEIEANEEIAFQLFLEKLKNIDGIFAELLTTKQLQSWFHVEGQGFSVFEKVSLALKQLPSDYIRMPVFAYRQTGDAHAFDESQPAGRLLLQLLAKLSADAIDSTEPSQGLAATEEKNMLLNQFYLLRDDILNFVTIHGLVAEKAGIVSQMWRQSAIEKCSWNVPLKEVLRMDWINPRVGDRVLIVENSGVYSILVDLLPELPLICSSGQFSYAVWQLLRKLVSSDTQLYYCGDMDPEGLLMAQRLLEIFPSHAKTLGMTLKTYQQAAMSSQISNARLKQLRQVKNKELNLIAIQIQETKKIALQEGVINLLIDEVKQVFDC